MRCLNMIQYIALSTVLIDTFSPLVLSDDLSDQTQEASSRA